MSFEAKRIECKNGDAFILFCRSSTVEFAFWPAYRYSCPHVLMHSFPHSAMKTHVGRDTSLTPYSCTVLHFLIPSDVARIALLHYPSICSHVNFTEFNFLTAFAPLLPFNSVLMLCARHFSTHMHCVHFYSFFSSSSSSLLSFFLFNFPIYYYQFRVFHLVCVRVWVCSNGC